MLWWTASKLARQLRKTVASVPNKTTKGRKHQRCKRGWLYTSNMVTIFSFLLRFISMEERSYLSTAIARCIGMKHPNIKNAPCLLPQKSLAWISALASSLRLADAGTRDSSVSGCKGGSTIRSWHTSWSQLAVKFLSSLWQMKVKPPWRQIKPCSWMGRVASQPKWRVFGNEHVNNMLRQWVWTRSNIIKLSN